MMIYINGTKASKEDWEAFKKWTVEGKTTAKARLTKGGLFITTSH